MNQMIMQQEEQNKKLAEELENLKSGKGSFSDFERLLNSQPKPIKGGLSSTGKEAFPEDFVFRQNEFRSEDLEVEERALMNITA